MKWNQGNLYSNDDMLRMQGDAIKRVQEMQNRATKTLEQANYNGTMPSIPSPPHFAATPQNYKGQYRPPNIENAYTGSGYVPQENIPMSPEIVIEPDIFKNVTPNNATSNNSHGNNQHSSGTQDNNSQPNRNNNQFNNNQSHGNTHQQMQNNNGIIPNLSSLFGGGIHNGENGSKSDSPFQIPQMLKSIPLLNGKGMDSLTSILENIGLDTEKIILIALIFLLSNEGADKTLILALGYLLF